MGLIKLPDNFGTISYESALKYGPTKGWGGFYDSVLILNRKNRHEQAVNFCRGGDFCEIVLLFQVEIVGSYHSVVYSIVIFIFVFIIG